MAASPLHSHDSAEAFGVLQDALYDFAARETPSREEALPGLFTLIEDTVVSDMMPPSSDLKWAARDAAAIEYLIEGGDLRRPFTGAHTLVTVEHDGTVAGASEKVDHHLATMFGDLMPHATRKAVLGLHYLLREIQAEDGFGGLSTSEGLADARRLVPARMPVHRGEDFVLVSGDSGLGGLAIGGSGCALEFDYEGFVMARFGIGDGSLAYPAWLSAVRAAGDQEFVNLVLQTIKGEQPPFRMDEPYIFSDGAAMAEAVRAQTPLA